MVVENEAPMHIHKVALDENGQATIRYRAQEIRRL
jgi:hypothetical protein